MFSLEFGLVLQDQIHQLAGQRIGYAEVDAGDDDEPDHDPGRLHHLPAVGPLYPLQLVPASL
jgi:hypothetical protein